MITTELSLLMDEKVRLEDLNAISLLEHYEQGLKALTSYEMKIVEDYINIVKQIKRLTK